MNSFEKTLKMSQIHQEHFILFFSISKIFKKKQGMKTKL
jgi:hypothetical protein